MTQSIMAGIDFYEHMHANDTAGYREQHEGRTIVLLIPGVIWEVFRETPVALDFFNLNKH